MASGSGAKPISTPLPVQLYPGAAMLMMSIGVAASLALLIYEVRRETEQRATCAASHLLYTSAPSAVKALARRRFQSKPARCLDAGYSRPAQQAAGSGGGIGRSCIGDPRPRVAVPSALDGRLRLTWVQRIAAKEQGRVVLSVTSRRRCRCCSEMVPLLADVCDAVAKASTWHTLPGEECFCLLRAVCKGPC